VDLLVPLLVLVAIGGIASWLPGLLAGRARRAGASSGARPARRIGSRASAPLLAPGKGQSASPLAGLPGSPGRGVLWLARRRLGEAGAERRLAVLVMTAGLGMLLFALAAIDSTQVAADDRVAVAAG